MGEEIGEVRVTREGGEVDGEEREEGEGREGHWGGGGRRGKRDVTRG